VHCAGNGRGRTVAAGPRAGHAAGKGQLGAGRGPGTGDDPRPARPAWSPAGPAFGGSMIVRLPAAAAGYPLSRALTLCRLFRSARRPARAGGGHVKHSRLAAGARQPRPGPGRPVRCGGPGPARGWAATRPAQPAFPQPPRTVPGPVAGADRRIRGPAPGLRIRGSISLRILRHHNHLTSADPGRPWRAMTGGRRGWSDGGRSPLTSFMRPGRGSLPPPGLSPGCAARRGLDGRFAIDERAPPSRAGTDVPRSAPEAGCSDFAIAKPECRFQACALLHLGKIQHGNRTRPRRGRPGVMVPRLGRATTPGAGASRSFGG